MQTMETRTPKSSETLKRRSPMSSKTKKMTRIRKEEEEDHQPVLNAPTCLPEYIIEDNILSRIPVKSLIRFRCVNKQWRSLLTNNSTFIKKHLSHAIKKDENHGLVLKIELDFYSIPNGIVEERVKLDGIPRIDYLIVGSSNGLLCVYQLRSEKIIYLWNPAIRQHKILRGFKFHRIDIAGLGFGFSPLINDYKVVVLGRIKHQQSQNSRDDKIGVEIYSMKTNKWRNLGLFPYNIIGGIFLKTNINGVNYWIASHAHSLNRFVLSFDMADEVFREIPLPDGIELLNIKYLHLRPLRGCLSLLFKDRNNSIDVLVMKEDNVNKSWVKLFTFQPLETYHRPIGFLKNGEVVLSTGGQELISYDSACLEFKNLGLPEVSYGWDSDLTPYVESLVPVTAARIQAKGKIANGKQRL